MKQSTGNKFFKRRREKRKKKNRSKSIKCAHEYDNKCENNYNDIDKKLKNRRSSLLTVDGESGGVLQCTGGEFRVLGSTGKLGAVVQPRGGEGQGGACHGALK